MFTIIYAWTKTEKRSKESKELSYKRIRKDLHVKNCSKQERTQSDFD